MRRQVYVRTRPTDWRPDVQAQRRAAGHRTVPVLGCPRLHVRCSALLGPKPTLDFTRIRHRSVKRVFPTTDAHPPPPQITSLGKVVVGRHLLDAEEPSGYETSQRVLTPYACFGKLCDRLTHAASGGEPNACREHAPCCESAVAKHAFTAAGGGPHEMLDEVCGARRAPGNHVRDGAELQRQDHRGSVLPTEEAALPSPSTPSSSRSTAAGGRCAIQKIYCRAGARSFTLAARATAAASMPTAAATEPATSWAMGHIDAPPPW
jgi:hypothetical protein